MIKAAGRLPAHVGLSASINETRPDDKSKNLHRGRLMNCRKGPTVFVMICKRIFKNFRNS